MQGMYVVHDIKAGIFNSPFFALNDQVALRVFEDVCHNPKTSVHQHPEDYNLYKLGDYDESNGKMDLLDIPDLLVGALGFVAKAKHDQATAKDLAILTRLTAISQRAHSVHSQNPTEVSESLEDLILTLIDDLKAEE